MPGFRVPPKPKPPPIEELTVRELRDLYDRNTKILATPSVNTHTFFAVVSINLTPVSFQGSFHIDICPAHYG